MSLKTILTVSSAALAVVVGVVLLAFGLPTSGWKALSVQTGSMAPSIQPGNLVLVKHVPVTQIAVGDVITYSSQENPGQTITHRVTQVRGDTNKPLQFVTKGDANPSVDQFTVPMHRVVGKVSATIPYAGFLADSLRTPLGLIIAIYLPALLVVIAELRRLSAYYNTQKAFRLPWVKGSLYKSRPKNSIVAGSKALGLCVIVAAVVASPTYAAFTTQATLVGNTIITTRPPADHVVISDIFFRKKGGAELSTKPQFKLYNPTNQAVSLAGWSLADNQAEVVRFSANTTIGPNQTFTQNIHDFSQGLQLAGDRLVLKNAAGLTIDALSWGTDTSQLNPAVPAVTTGDKLQRIPRMIDTNTANDWKIKP